MSPWFNRKPALGQRSTLKKHLTSMSYKLEPTIWSRDTGQRIPCFDRCQLIITWISNIKEVHGKPRLHICQPIIWSMAAMLRDSIVIVAIVRTRPWAIPLAMITMRKSTHGFPSLSYMSMGLRLAALWAAGAPLIYELIYAQNVTSLTQKDYVMPKSLFKH